LAPFVSSSACSVIRILGHQHALEAMGETKNVEINEAAEAADDEISKGGHMNYELVDKEVAKVYMTSFYFSHL
jgi:hypothetical protein